MTSEAGDPVVGHSEHAEDPSQYVGKTFTIARLNDKMEMVPHYAKILDPEIVFFLRAQYHRQEELLHRSRVEDHLLAIGPRRHVVSRALL